MEDPSNAWILLKRTNNEVNHEFESNCHIELESSLPLTAGRVSVRLPLHYSSVSYWQCHVVGFHPSKGKAKNSIGVVVFSRSSGAGDNRFERRILRFLPLTRTLPGLKLC